MFQNLAVLQNQDLHSPKKLVSPLRALPYHPMITLKRLFLYLFARPNPINVTAMTKHHAQFYPTPSSTRQTLTKARIFTTTTTTHPITPSPTNSLPPPQHTKKYLLYCAFSKSLTYNQANLKELHNQDIKEPVTTKNIIKKTDFD